MIAIIFGLMLGLVGAALMFSVIVLPPMIWRAFVMSKMWLWFIVPIFNVIPIGWIACIGFTAFLGMFVRYDIEKTKLDIENTQKLPFNEQMKKLFQNISMSFTIPFVTLLIGWLTKDYVLTLVK